MKKLKLYSLCLFVVSLIYASILILLTNNISQIIDKLTLNMNVDKWLLMSSLIYLVIYLITLYLSPIVYRIVSIKAENEFNTFYINRILNQDAKFYVEHNIGYINRLINDVLPEYANYKVTFIPTLIYNSLSVICYFTYIFIKNYQMGFVLVLLLAILFFISSKMTKKLSSSYQKSREKSGNTDAKFIEIVENAYAIKSLDETDIVTKNYLKYYKEEKYKSNYDFQLIDGAYTALFMTLTFAVPIIMLVIGIVFKNAFTVSVAAVIAIYTLSGNLQEPIRQLSNVVSDYKKNKENKKMLDDLKEVSCNKEKIDNYKIIDFKSKGLTFDNKTILKDVEFQIVEGKNYGIYGESGIGKSTIFNYLLGNQESDNISVWYDKKNIKDINVSRLVTCATQQIYIFHDSIKYNITLGKEFSDEELNEVIQVCCLNDFVKDYGFTKEIDNTDSNVSGGEKQRICLARVLIRKSKIVLLDEITSSLDTETSKKLTKNIYDYTKKYHMSFISISHKNEFDNLIDEKINI